MIRFKILPIIFTLFSTITLLAQEYKIGPEDVLEISFWQQPELNTRARVSQGGTIVLPVIGKITAAGLTPTELSTKIAKKISLFNKDISQASVVVVKYGSKVVYVTGHVLHPGKLTFEVIPDIWKIILEAGGPDEAAILNRVKIIRGSVKAGKTLTVDLEDYLNHGDLSKLPPVYPGDTINIPGIVEEDGGEGQTVGGVISTKVSDNIIYIYGEVAHPGGYQFNKNLTLLQAIVLAGGPTSQAKLEEVKVIMRGRPYSSVATVDLNKYATNGTTLPFLIKPGDTIYIPRKRSSNFFNFLGDRLLTQFLQVVITTGTSILIFNLMN